MENVEEAFTKIVSHIFNNWYALQLAVEHCMGGPNSKETAKECLNYIVQYCLYEPNVDVHMIQDALEDILDEEFETVCEDNSPHEVANLLFKFVTLLTQGNLQECEAEYQKLPVANSEWLVQVNRVQNTSQNESTSSDDSDIECNVSPKVGSSSNLQSGSSKPQDFAMEDDGWKQVKIKGRKKK